MHIHHKPRIPFPYVQHRTVPYHRRIASSPTPLTACPLSRHLRPVVRAFKLDRKLSRSLFIFLGSPNTPVRPRPRVDIRHASAEAASLVVSSEHRSTAHAARPLNITEAKTKHPAKPSCVSAHKPPSSSRSLCTTVLIQKHGNASRHSLHPGSPLVPCRNDARTSQVGRPASKNHAGHKGAMPDCTILYQICSRELRVRCDSNARHSPVYAQSRRLDIFSLQNDTLTDQESAGAGSRTTTRLWSYLWRRALLSA